MADTLVRAAAQARRAAFDAQPGAQRRTTDPAGGVVRPSPSVAVEVRAEEVTRDGKAFLRLLGHASTYERTYPMWDFFGPYDEEVKHGAGAQSLATNPDVVFLINHTGLPLARTKATTLDLSEDEVGLLSDAYMNPQRGDARDLYEATRSGDVCEMSFAFRIPDDGGRWSEDFCRFSILRYDLERGDTSAVTYGANPHTDIAARAADFQAMLRAVDGPALRAAHDFLAGRLGITRSTVEVDVVANVPDLSAFVASLSATERTEVAALLAAPAPAPVAAAVEDASAAVGTELAAGMPLSLATAILAASE
jgi:HK97 family phage prohead protease